MKAVKEMTDSRYLKDPFKDRVCPLINGACLKEGCMAYTSSVVEWDDTKLEDAEGDVDGVMVTKATETITGVRYKGTVHQCTAGIFDRKVTDVEIIKEESHEITAPSSIILTSQG